jgi:hypothetical protein
MPNQPKTPLRRLRVDEELWEAFGIVAEPDRSAVIRDFMRWYVRETGAKMPKRPEVEIG